MKNWKIIVFGVVVVTIIAAGKTAAGIRYFSDEGQVATGFVSLLFALFWLLTATVAAGAFSFFQRVTSSRHPEIRTMLDDTPGKECLLEAHAKCWCLTSAETDIAVMVVKGFSNHEIARMRGTALQTVKTQLSSIYQKSGLCGRYQLIAYITDEVCEMSRARLQHQRTGETTRALHE